VRTSEFSCQGINFCGANATLQKAAPSDLQINCNFTTQELTQGLSLQILPIKEIRIHPGFNPLTNNQTQEGGPIAGSDISVYIVDDSDFTMHPDFVWPACLPRADDSYLPGNKGILSGWIAPPPLYLFDGNSNLLSYELNQLFEKEALYAKVRCEDPDWMWKSSNSFYPAGTACYADPAAASSVEFGISGSGIMRPFVRNVRENESVRYSWAGALSMSKGANYPRISPTTVVMLSNNPTVFTDGSCYLDWIAAQYNLSLPADFTVPARCSQSAGSKQDVNQTTCISRSLEPTTPFGNVSYCNFSFSSYYSQCRLYTLNRDNKPAISKNFYVCSNTEDEIAACANNCRGVDPNAVVVGGTAALFSLAAAASVAAAGPDLLGSALGAGSLVAVLGVGSMAMNSARTACAPPRCRASFSQQCCTPVVVNGRRVCPVQC